MTPRARDEQSLFGCFLFCLFVFFRAPAILASLCNEQGHFHLLDTVCRHSSAITFDALQIALDKVMNLNFLCVPQLDNIHVPCWGLSGTMTTDNSSLSLPFHVHHDCATSVTF